MKTYDLLVILDLAGKEESLPEVLAQVEGEVKAVGGRVTRTQKMDRKKFEYVAGPLESGFYANLTIELPGDAVGKLRGKAGAVQPGLSASFGGGFEGRGWSGTKNSGASSGLGRNHGQPQ